MNLQASGWAIRRRQLPKPSTTPLSVIHWWGEDQEESGGRGQYISRPNRRGSPPRRSQGVALDSGSWGIRMGPAAVDTLNADQSGLRVTEKTIGTEKSTPVLENSPRRAGQKQISRRLTHFQYGTEFHCHFASQDRNASPKKAGGAVNSKQSNKHARKTGRPGPAVRDFGKIAFAQFWIRVLGGF